MFKVGILRIPDFLFFFGGGMLALVCVRAVVACVCVLGYVFVHARSWE